MYNQIVHDVYKTKNNFHNEKNKKKKMKMIGAIWKKVLLNVWTMSGKENASYYSLDLFVAIYIYIYMYMLTHTYMHTNI